VSQNKLSANCVTLQPMRRAQAILVMIALLAAPLALLAPAAGAAMASCEGMCCLPHHGPHSSAAQHPAAQNHEAAGESCEHGAAQQPMNCAMKCGEVAPDYGFLSSLAPAKASSLVSIARIDLSTGSSLPSAANASLPGFLADPFQPPRA
jgi:hypothetical protein